MGNDILEMDRNRDLSAELRTVECCKHAAAGQCTQTERNEKLTTGWHDRMQFRREPVPNSLSLRRNRC